MHRSTSLAVVLSLLVMPTTCCKSATAANDKLAKHVDEMFAAYDGADSPGCAVGIMHKNKLVYSKGFGVANMDHEVPNTPDTIFEIGSLAKSFTCACIAILMDQKKISPDDEIRKYVPEMHPFDPPIRVRHLIRCRSGIWAQWHIAQLAGWRAEPVEAPYTEQDMLTLLSGQTTLPFKPGSQFRYGTGDYFLLGVIVRRVTGQSLADFAKQHLFDPLGMDNTFIMQKPRPHCEAAGYWLLPSGRWPVAAVAARFFSTGWQRAVHQRGRSGSLGRKLLQEPLAGGQVS